MYELKTSYISKTLTNFTQKFCKNCQKGNCTGCDAEPVIKIIDRINDGEPVVDDTRLKQ